MLDSIVLFFFFFPSNYKLLGHNKINFGKFMIYFSRNLRGKKKASMIQFFFYILKKVM